nr:MAG TPA: hypothetical protein [Bacteriophage sp.]
MILVNNNIARRIAGRCVSLCSYALLILSKRGCLPMVY